MLSITFPLEPFGGRHKSPLNGSPKGHLDRGLTPSVGLTNQLKAVYEGRA